MREQESSNKKWHQVLSLKTAVQIAILAAVWPFVPGMSASTFKLQRIWDVSVGTDGSRMPGVCTKDDGTVYVADPSGTWTVISPDGRVVQRQDDSSIAGVSSLACGSDALYANFPGTARVVIYTWQLSQVRVIQLPRPFRFVYADRRGNLYGLGLWNGFLVHKIGADGSVTSFGDAPGYASAQEERFHTISTTAVIDERTGEIIYKPQSPFRFYVYDMAGRKIATHDSKAPFRATRVEHTPKGTRFLPSDISGPFVKLSDGRYVVLTIRPRQLADGVWSEPGAFEILNESFEPVGSVPAAGMLITRDRQDNLYGVVGNPTLRLIKSRIVESGR